MNNEMYHFNFLPGNDERLKSRLQKSQPGYTHRQYLRYLWAINYFLEARVVAKNRYYSTGAPFCREGLANISSKRGEATNILDNLRQWQMITLTREHRQGACRRYRLGKELEGLAVTILPVAASEARFVRKMIEKRMEAINSSPLLQNQYSILQTHVTINKAGFAYLKSKYPSVPISRLIAAYEAGELLSKQDLTACFHDLRIDPVDMGLFGFLTRKIYVVRPKEESRIYTNLTNIKRTFRGFLRLGGKPLLMTDISNSQVLFSVPVLLKKLGTSLLPSQGGYRRYVRSDDFRQYIHSAERGTFFEDLMHKIKPALSIADRDTVKERFWKQVFFGKVQQVGELKEAFRTHYPRVAVAINQMKLPDHAQFAITLQQEEASVMIDVVLKDMTENGKLALSIHDAIVVNNAKDRDYAERLIAKTMWERYYLKPAFKH